MKKRMDKTSLTAKSQITLPKHIREELGLHPGDRVGLEMDKNGVRIVPASADLEKNFAQVKSSGKTKDASRMRKEFQQGVAEEVQEESD